jgi:hypothetical protein
MTEPSMTLNEYLRKIGTNLEGDFLREGLALLAQIVKRQLETPVSDN